MPSFGDSLSDDDLRELIKQHGVDAANRLGDLPDTASDDDIRAVLAPKPGLVADTGKRFLHGAYESVKQPVMNIAEAYTGVGDPWGLKAAKEPMDYVKGAGRAATDIGTAAVAPVIAAELGPAAGVASLLGLAGTMGGAEAVHLPEAAAWLQKKGDVATEDFARKHPEATTRQGILSALDALIEPGAQIAALHGAGKVAGAVGERVGRAAPEAPAETPAPVPAEEAPPAAPETPYTHPPISAKQQAYLDEALKAVEKMNTAPERPESKPFLHEMRDKGSPVSPAKLARVGKGDPNASNDIFAQQGFAEEPYRPSPKPTPFDEIVRPLPSRGNEFGPALPEPIFEPRISDARTGGPLDGLLGKQQSLLAPEDTPFNLAGDIAKQNALEEMQANQPGAFKRQMVAEQARQTAKPAAEVPLAMDDLLKTPEAQAHEWERYGMTKEAYDAEMSKEGARVNAETKTMAGGPTPLLSHARRNGGFNQANAAKAGQAAEFSAESLGGKSLASKKGGKGLEEMLRSAKEDGLAPDGMDLNAYRDALDAEQTKAQKIITENGGGKKGQAYLNSLMSKANKLRGNERGSVGPGAIYDAVTGIQEAGKRLIYEPAKPIGEGASEMAKALAMSEPGRLTQNLAKFASPESLDPVMMVKIRALDNAKQLEFVMPLKSAVTAAEKGAKLYSLYKGPVPKGVVEALRANENLGPDAKVFVTNGKLVNLAVRGKIPMESLPAPLQMAAKVFRQVNAHIAKREGIPAEKMADNYMANVITDPEMLNKLRAEKAAGYQMAPDGTSAVITDPYLKERLGVSGFTMDPVRATLARIDAASKKLYSEPMRDVVNEAIAKQGADPAKSNIVKALEAYRDENVMGQASAGDKVWDETLKGFTPDAVRNLVAKVDKTPVIRMARDLGVIDGELSNMLPRNGWTKAFEQEIAADLHSAYLGLNIRTIARDSFNRLANTLASEGPTATFKGYSKFLQDDVVKSLFVPKFKSEFAKAHAPTAFSDMVALQADMGNSRGFRQQMRHLVMKPLELSFTMDRGATYYAALAKAAKMAEKGLFPKDMKAMHEYALGTVNKTVFGHGALETSAAFNHPLTRPLQTFAASPRKILQLYKKMLKAPADARIMKVPVSAWRMMLFAGLATTAADKMGVDAKKWTGADYLKVMGHKFPVPIPGMGIAKEMLEGYLPENQYEGFPAAKIGRDVLEVGRGVAGGHWGKEQKEAVANAGRQGLDTLLGSVNYPESAVNNTIDAFNELKSGYALKGTPPALPFMGSERKRSYRTDPLEVLLKNTNLSGRKQTAYREAVKKNAEKRSR